MLGTVIKIMDADEREFYERKESLNTFKSELKALILKHKITVDTQCEYLTPQDDCDGVGTDVDYVLIDGEKWYNENLSEIIMDCFNCA